MPLFAAQDFRAKKFIIECKLSRQRLLDELSVTPRDRDCLSLLPEKILLKIEDGLPYVDLINGLYLTSV